MTGSVPTFNGPHYYAGKLVRAGHKVGIISQTETAAGKKFDNATNSKTFSRALTDIFTPSTFIENFPKSDENDKFGGGKSALMAIWEEKENEDKIRISMCSCCPSNGEILFDDFNDDLSRNELQRRLETIQPLELLIQQQDTINQAIKNHPQFLLANEQEFNCTRNFEWR